ncbi:sugar phosphate isomerase/epimerase family protein [Streptomyces roseochromogenus]|uniref:Xylose isomerase-like TIM barrel domain-containing protein n=1 Tax=Streptomyces roseochromogenus subsp. oscitans DS 12.976 TaxID=1352936 RepID=V6K799_STRRC|nr:sugar phosphate isomerase/epimerase family protein [Streptomyces roseochromogenus]EST27276.1 hypothetical protein M878_25085 [Streptomyces roseochromogenus subsp. oscitans DS 12.976]
MRLAIINDEIDQSLDRAIGLATHLGYTGLEVRSVWNRPPHLLDDGQLRRIRETLASAGLEVAGFCPPALKCALPRTSQDAARVRAELEDAIRRARLLGSPTVRIFSFFRDGDPDPSAAATVARDVLAGLDWHGVEPLVESGTRTNTPTMRHLMDFLDQVGDDRLGALWDPGNSVFSGWDPQPFPADYTLGRERIKHVHVKDPAGRSGYVRMGDGDLPWREILTALSDDGYAGWLSLETHWRIGRVLTAGQRDEPWGDTFSEGGSEASATCMRLLSALLDDVRQSVGARA